MVFRKKSQILWHTEHVSLSLLKTEMSKVCMALKTLLKYLLSLALCGEHTRKKQYKLTVATVGLSWS